MDLLLSAHLLTACAGCSEIPFLTTKTFIMKPEMILQADVLDIIFENRNKEYGAYALRKEYGKRLMYSLSGVVCVLLMGIVFLNLKGKDARYVTTIPFSTDSPITPVDLVPPKPPQQVVAPATRSVAFKTPLIVPDHKVTDTIPTLASIAKAVISDKTTEGPPLEGPAVVTPAGNPGGQVGKIEQQQMEEPAILHEAEVMPEFPGGIAGWQRFLQKNLRFPDAEEDRESSIKIVVHVKFVVNEDGSLTGLEIVQSGGKDFDTEVIRVMKKSPKWVAGSDKGRKVKIYRKQPIVFTYSPE
jgi:periplasmic protein TonB